MPLTDFTLGADFLVLGLVFIVFKPKRTSAFFSVYMISTYARFLSGLMRHMAPGDPSYVNNYKKSPTDQLYLYFSVPM